MYDSSKSKSYWDACKKSATSSYKHADEYDIGKNNDPMETSQTANIGNNIAELGGWTVGACVGGMIRYGMTKDNKSSK